MRRNGMGVWMVVVGLVLALGCGSSDPSADAVREDPIPEDPMADLRLNEIQVVGSHNSYKIQPSDGLQTAIVLVSNLPGAEDAPNPEGLVYTHPPLAEQLGTQGVRQLELDVWVDPDPVRFADPFARRAIEAVNNLLTLGLLNRELVGLEEGELLPYGEPFDPDDVMLEPGLKVFHVQDIDFRSRCLTWRQCLEDVHDWSELNPNHLPIFILVELKQEVIDVDLSAFGLAFTTPTPWTVEDILELEDGIRTVFDDNEIILPDDVRRGYPTLMEAIRAEGWPLVDDHRGKVWFGLDNGGSILAEYVDRYPGLAGAYLFTSSPTGSPEAAFRKENDPAVSDPSIAELIELGYLVRTRADADTVESRQNDPTRRDLAFASGAQFISTDYRVPNLEFSPYSVQFPDLPEDAVARCNPVSSSEGCVSEEIAP